MRKLYVKQINTRNSQTATTVRDSNGTAQYLVTGNFGRADSFIHVYNQLGELVAEFEQVSFGLLPRFNIKFQNQTVGSIGMSLGTLLDMIYVRDLNWFIRGSLTNGVYYAYHRQEKLMTVRPVSRANGSFNELSIRNQAQEPILIGIAVILNRWLFNSKLDPLKNLILQPRGLAYTNKGSIKINQ